MKEIRNFFGYLSENINNPNVWRGLVVFTLIAFGTYATVVEHDQTGYSYVMNLKWSYPIGLLLWVVALGLNRQREDEGYLSKTIVFFAGFLPLSRILGIPVDRPGSEAHLAFGGIITLTIFVFVLLYITHNLFPTKKEKRERKMKEYMD